ncbi:hypothetical protein N9Y36_04785 [Ulvibacter sp.]|nr:hypothetical protein [Ulvibacter sp.]
MKKIIFLFFFLPILCFGQLNKNARAIYDNDKELFNSIKYYANEIYPGDGKSQDSEINLQCKAYIDLTQIAFDVELYHRAVEKNVMYVTLFRKMVSNGEILKAYKTPINWVRVLDYYRDND